MRRIRLFFSTLLLLLFVLNTAAQEEIPQFSPSHFPNIHAALDDRFFNLAEQLARGVLRERPLGQEECEAILYLSHSLWGQQHYAEILDLLEGRNEHPGYIYWRARAFFELKRYPDALKTLAHDKAAVLSEETHYTPASIRLKGHMEQISGQLKAAEKTYLAFSDRFPNHQEQIQTLFDLAVVYTLQNRPAEALAVYEQLAAESDRYTAVRANLKRARLLYSEKGGEKAAVAREILIGLATDKSTRLSARIDAYIELTALEEQSGRKLAAMDAMRRAIALSPDAKQRVPLKMSLAKMQLQENNTTEALKLLETCRAETPNEVVAATLQLWKSKALYQAGRFMEANESYQIYLDVADDPDGRAEAYFGKGLALWELERYAEAAGVFDKAVKILNDPDIRADALFKAGDSYYKIGKPEDAEKRYRLFVTDYPGHRNQPNALYQLGLALSKTARHAEALSTFEMLTAEHASSPFAEQAVLRTADVLRADRKWEAVLNTYERIERTCTNRAIRALAWYQKAEVLYRLGRFQDALDSFETVMRLFPESEYAPQTSYRRSICLYLLGQTEAAAETCRNFIREHSDSPWVTEAMFWLAEQYFNQGNYEEAEPLFMRIANEFGDNRLAPQALYWAGRAAAERSDYIRAIERYSEVARSYPESEILPQTRFAQGDALTELGEFARAILAFEEIIKNYPQSYLVNAAWGRKGDCQFSLASEEPDRYAEAVNTYRIILDRPSTEAELKLQIEYKLGRCQEKTGKGEKAFKRYMNVVYTFINGKIEHSPYSLVWFTRAAFGAASLKEKQKAWPEAVQVYERVVQAQVPAAEEAFKRIEKIKNENWLLFQQLEERSRVGVNG